MDEWNFVLMYIEKSAHLLFLTKNEDILINIYVLPF